MGAFSNFLINAEANNESEKRKKTKGDMIDFIFIYDQSISKEKMESWSLEKVRNKYNAIKEERNKRIDREFQENRGLAKKIRRNYYD